MPDGSDRPAPARPGFLVVPQWQGSSSARAMCLVDGAEAVRADLPAASTDRVEVPVEAGDDLGTAIRRLSSIEKVAAAVRQRLAAGPAPTILIGGDAGADLAALAAAIDGSRGDVAVAWFAAHPALHDPISSPTGAVHRMVVRALLGDVHPALGPAEPLAPGRIVLVGARAFDDAEAALAAERGIAVVPPRDDAWRGSAPEAAAEWADTVAEAVAATGASRVYVHVDLDVLDPAEVGSLHFPEPFGLAVADLVAAIGALRRRFAFAGGALTEFCPDSPDDVVADMGTVLRVVGALSR